jgi:hypothetical protein
MDELEGSARSLLQHAWPAPSAAEKATDEEWQFFMSYTHEDAETVAVQLAENLAGRGFSVWRDNDSLRLGDDFKAAIREALERCGFGIAIWSPQYSSRMWTIWETKYLLALEDRDGRKRLLPVRHEVDQQTVERHYGRLLARRVTLSTEAGIEKVAAEIALCWTQQQLGEFGGADL